MGGCANEQYQRISLRTWTSFQGLDKDPKFLADSMSATTSPEKAAEASVLVSGGFDPCQYEVNESWRYFCEVEIHGDSTSQ